MSQFWNDLSGAAKAGFVVGALSIVGVVSGGAYWVLRAEYEPVMRSSSPEKVAAAVREVERLKIPYRVSGDGTSVEVQRADLGRVRVGLADGGAGSSAGVGFELFNNTDFSTTEFTQKINYQRALQGELARTVSSIDGVASSRVHLVLPESGFLRRQAVRPTAAVTVVMEAGAQLNPNQVQGIQKLVAATVPSIMIDDIAVIDQEGVALTRTKSGVDDSLSNGRLEVKREVDAYLEGKIKRLLANMDPTGEYGISVDATLSLDDVKVTTEDVLPVDGGNGVKNTGVLVRERQSQRHDGAGPADPSGAASSPGAGSVTREVEYKVGHRIEQVATVPGGITRISVAVIARADHIEMDRVKDLIAHAVGADESRGDSVAVVILPGTRGTALEFHSAPHSGGQSTTAALGNKSATGETVATKVVSTMAWFLGLGLLSMLGWLVLRRGNATPAASAPTSEDIDRVVGRINHWLDEGKTNGA
ncbi:MAG: flagellar basal-body MS-ring/collar protein FliF [Pseudomonadota bacterium]